MSFYGFITKESIKATQKKWIVYRDARVAFGSTHCPAITDISFKTIITKERIEQLKLMAEFL